METSLKSGNQFGKNWYQHLSLQERFKIENSQEFDFLDYCSTFSVLHCYVDNDESILESTSDFIIK